MAAGLGTRLRPLTETTPKCLVEINGKPLLEYWFDHLADADIDPVLINLHYLPDKVKALVETRNDRNKIYTVYESNLLGTAGTLRANAWFCLNEPVMVIHADNLCLSNLITFSLAHEQRPIGADITMMTFLSDNPEQCGIVELDDKNVVTAFHEKSNNPPSNLANAAVYIFEPNVIQYICMQEKENIDISTEVLPYFVGRMYAWEADGFHIDIGTYSSLEKANSYFTKTL